MANDRVGSRSLMQWSWLVGGLARAVCGGRKESKKEKNRQNQEVIRREDSCFVEFTV